MRSGLITWPDVAEVGGPVLMIVNSPDGDERAVSAVFDALEGRVPPARLHVIATPVWHRWLCERGWADARVLFSADARGAELELNYFLESSDALHWIASKKFTLVLGSAAQSLYNEEVKEIFERQVAVFLGDAVFLTHTLPEAYVFALGLTDLVQRANRSGKVAEYRTVARALLDDLRQLWIDARMPSRDDAGPFVDVAGVLERHLGGDLLSWDERSAIPLTRPDPAKAAAEFVRYVESVLHRVADQDEARADDLRATIADASGRLVHLQREIDGRDRLLGELNAQAHELQRSIAQQQEEINRRDRRIVELQEELTREVTIRDRNLVALQEELTREVAIRDRNLVALQEELRREVAIRDRNLVALQEELTREVAIRDRNLVALHEELTRQVAIRDRNLVELQKERTEAVSVRDTIIDELRRERAESEKGH